MAEIPSTINGVTVEFGDRVNKTVDQKVIDALQACIKGDIAPGHRLTTIYISSANDQHTLPSRHMQQKAVDISRINGTRMAIGYPSNAAIKAICDAIQNTFESFPHRRENYGPLFRKKLGKDWPVGGHKDHIHLSVN
jgi:hypothetical protein